MRDELVASLVQFAELSSEPEFGDHTWIEDFGLDSLSLFHFLLSVEKEFDLTFSEGDLAISRLENFNSLVEMVKRSKGQA